MAEVMYNDSRDGLVTLINSTAASNIAAGTPLAIGTGGGAIYTLGDNVVNFSATALMGYHFIGIADQNYSAGDCPVTVWTKGVFRLQTTADGNSATNCHAGQAVFASSGSVVRVGAAATTGDMAIGSIVSRPLSGSNTWCDVKINPSMFRWSVFAGAGPTASANPVFAFPGSANSVIHP